jgi:hypothetical protein
MAQYLLECVYPDDNALGGYRSETFSIEADDQREAIEEATRAAVDKRPFRFRVRIVGNGFNKILHDSGPLSVP